MIILGKSEKEPIWEIIKESLHEYLKAETTSPGGKLNLIFGILLFILTLACFGEKPIDYICKLIKPNFDIGIPWYGTLIMFILTASYFSFCVKSIIDIEKTRQNNA